MTDTEPAPAATVRTPQPESRSRRHGSPGRSDGNHPRDTATPEAAAGDAEEGSCSQPNRRQRDRATCGAARCTPGDTGLEQAAPKDVKLRFNFRFQPWEDVLDWLAEQADLSLQSTLVPEGTFNYSDTHEYTPTEAIDLINGVLLTQGYTLVRRGRLLTVINLEDEVPDVLVEFVPVEKLDGRGEFELIKTVFHLAKMDPTDAEQEIQQLLGPGRKMIVMPKSRQILVTETAGKLRTIRDVIERAENPTGIKDKGVAEIQLKFVAPEEVLLIARPLLGLEDGKNVGHRDQYRRGRAGDASVCHGLQRQDPDLAGFGREGRQETRGDRSGRGHGTAAAADPSNPGRRSARGTGRHANALGRPPGCPHVARHQDQQDHRPGTSVGAPHDPGDHPSVGRRIAAVRSHSAAQRSTRKWRC